MTESRLQIMAGTIAKHVIASWETMEAEAGQQGQLYQDTDAANECHLRDLSALLEQDLKTVICQCADVCELRGRVDGKPHWERGEALKCANQVRHAMFAVDGQSYVCPA